MNTTEKYLNNLPAGYRERALENLVSSRADSQRTSMADAIESAFTWNETLEGGFFWNDVYCHYRYGDRSLPALPQTQSPVAPTSSAKVVPSVGSHILTHSDAIHEYRVVAFSPSGKYTCLQDITNGPGSYSWMKTEQLANIIVEVLKRASASFTVLPADK